jgi:hypothetical protein
MGTGSSIGPWIDEFKDTPVFFEYHRYYQTGDPSLLSFLYTFLNFGKKFEYVDKEFNETAFRGWMECEARLDQLVLDDVDCDNLRLIIQYCLPPPSDTDFWPKHGPGAVAERKIRCVADKHRAVVYHAAIADFLRVHLTENFNPAFIVHGERGWKEADKDAFPQLPSLLRFVAKNMKTARTICMEPATLMYFQQGVKEQLVKSIESGPLGRFIRLKDQSFNADLSDFGSRTSEVDTIDLSSASDLLSLDLVKRIFPDDWLSGMLATRSPVVRTSHGIKTIRKFAPMGSALCFPTQCIVFTAICIYAAHLYRKGLHHVSRCDDARRHPPPLLRGITPRSIVSRPLGLSDEPSKEYLNGEVRAKPMVGTQSEPENRTDCEPPAGVEGSGSSGPFHARIPPTEGGSLGTTDVRYREHEPKHAIESVDDGSLWWYQTSSMGDPYGKQPAESSALSEFGITGSDARMDSNDVAKACWLFRHQTAPYQLGDFYLQPLGVYGDDICCDRKITAIVKALLDRLGFRVNDEKSFTGSQAFRESCGSFILGGNDITPLYFRVRGVRGDLTLGPQQVVSQVDLINKARERGFTHLYRFLLHQLKSASKGSQGKVLASFGAPFVDVSSREFGIRSVSVHNGHLTKRYNTDLQRDEYRAWTVAYKDRYDYGSDHESYLYMRWWATRYDSVSDPEISGSNHTPTAGCRVKWRWTPLY